MADLECTSCSGDGRGTIVNTLTGETRPAQWACEECGGSGRLPQYKGLARTASASELDEPDEVETGSA